MELGDGTLGGSKVPHLVLDPSSLWATNLYQHYVPDAVLDVVLGGAAHETRGRHCEQQRGGRLR